VGAGTWHSVESACDTVVRIAEEVQPNARDSATLDQAYRSYRKIYPALQQIANGAGAEAAISSTTLSIS